MQSQFNTVSLLVLMVSLLTGFTHSNVNGQANVTANAMAEVIQAITATETAQLNFGRFSPEMEGGKIILSPQGARTIEGTVVLGGGAPNPAKFTITGEYEATFSINLPSASATLTNISNAKTMEVNGWESFPPSGIGVGKLAGGDMMVSIGAVLNIGNMASNPVGIYIGTYAITFAYN